MKRFAVLVILAVFAVPLFARPARRLLPRANAPVKQIRAERVESPQEWGRQLLAQLHGPRKSTAKGARSVRSEAILINRSARGLVIPAAGSARGAGGTFFRTDLTLVNWNVEDQLLGVLWVPNGNPSGFDAFIMELPGDLPPFTIEDFVGTVLEKTGVGSLVLLPVTSAVGSPEVDENAAIDAYSRIWTPQPNATGTVSQPFPGVEPEFMVGEYEAAILGLRQDAGYRTNYGILNLYDEALTFLVTIIPDDASGPDEWVETTVTVPATSMIQTSIPAGDHGLHTIFVTLEEDVPGDEQPWVTWASSTDNITGDGWVSIGANPYDDDDLDTEGTTP
jgi:hypothetical protein